MADGWAKPGEKVRFLGCNGYDRELAEAKRLWEPGQELTVRTRHIGDWTSSYEFAEIPGHFNTVMFEQIDQPRDGSESNKPLPANQ